MTDFSIVVPSRKRSRNMPTILKLLPTAQIFVDEREADEYRPVVPAKQLRLHPPTANLCQVRNLIPDYFPAPAVVQIDDDLQAVRLCRNSASKRTTDPEQILQIIENGVRIAADLDLGVFCWSRNLNNAQLDPNFKTIHFTMPISSSFVLRGAALRRRFDERFVGKADFDFSLTTLLQDRVILCDTRFSFDHGRIFSGRGGNVSSISSEQMNATSRRLAAKWGDSLSLKGRSFKGRLATSDKMSIRVKRRNPLAIR